MDNSYSRRLTAGIHRNLNENYVWPRGFGTTSVNMENPRVEITETVENHTTNELLEGMNAPDRMADTCISQPDTRREMTKSKHSSRNSHTTNNSKSSRSSTELQRKRIVLEAEIAKQQLLEQNMREKIRLIEMEKQLREEEIQELVDNRSRSSRRAETDIENKYFPGNLPARGTSMITDWIEHIPIPDEDSEQKSKPSKETLPGTSNPIFQMTSEHIDHICQIMKRNCTPGFSGHGGISNLPIFDGNPEDWPLFHNQLKRSTEIHHISDDENIIRLQKCLKGRAKEAVHPLLISSSNVSKIIETLEMTFGRPEFIISMLVDKVRRAAPPKEGRFETYLPFSNVVENLVTTMQLFNSIGHMNNPNLLNEIIVKLPPFLRLEWAKCTMNRINLSLREFSDWFRNIALAASTCTSAAVVDRKGELEYLDSRKKKENIFSTGRTQTDRNFRCILCKNNYHPLEKCDSFVKMEVNDKWKFITSQKLCFACLKPAHNIIKCRKKKKCEFHGCEKFHHPILHNSKFVENNAVTEISANVEETAPERIHHSRVDYTEVLLRVAPVKLRSHHKEIYTFALFDEAATTTLIDSSIAEEMRLDGPLEPLCYQWLNEVSRNEDESRRVSFEISGVDRDLKYHKVFGARTVQGLCLPRQTVNVEEMAKIYPYIKQAPLASFKNAQPMILLGQDQCALTIARKLYHGPSHNTPFVSKTLLGWIIHGKNRHSFRTLDRSLIYHLCCTSHLENDMYLHDLVKESFRTENFGVKVPEEDGKSKEDERAIEILEKTLRRVGNRFELGLLWRSDDDILPDSRAVALNRLKCMENKMDKNEEFANQYCVKIDEYLSEGYIRKLKSDEAAKTGPKTWYLPHFAVFNPNKPNKLRLVFDAAAKSNGVSLNNQLLQGPDLLKSLTAILWKFRQKKVAFCGDIKEMFHRVLIRDEDCSAQRFFWRGRDRKRAPEVFEMKVMTFGATSSPCMAQFVKNKNAEENMKDFAEAAKAIVEKHYVDDYLDSTETEVHAVKLISEVIEVHKRGGFEICNWISNSKEVLKTIPENLRAETQKKLNFFSQLSPERILGLWWRPETDDFTFSLSCHKVNPDVLSSKKLPTKREILKLTMSVFDPLGFLSPVTVKLKIFMQCLWRVGLGWEDTITPEMEPKWAQLMQEFKEIGNMSIPRCYGPDLFHSSTVELHGFCDTSEKAFAAVVYLRFGDEKACNPFHVAFVSAKTRVAPLKELSIPKLELQAAVILSRLMNTIKNNLEVKITASYLWTDSTTVLYWIRSEARRFKSFVAHRVGEILELTNVSNWFWVPGENNVADEGTRDCPKQNKNWLHGPLFLKFPKDSWPKEVPKTLNENALELKTEKILLSNIIVNSLPNVERFSKYRKLIRTTAWMNRFIGNCRSQRKTSTDLEIDEMKRAEEVWIRYVQNVCFAEEIYNLKKEKSVCVTSRLYTLSPILDENDILRIKGRLQNSDDLNFFQKYPIILDPKHRLTKLLIEDYHTKFHHQGQETVINEIRQKFWILRLRNAVRKCKNECFYCKKAKAKPIVPEMGQLPKCRLQSFVRPFTITGMDYFGPITVTIGRRHEKRYIVLFTCMSVRAVHLEIANTLNTDSAIMAIRRFIGRRGYPKEIHSDNGTNLHSAQKELKNCLKSLKTDEIQTFLSIKEIKWKFIPPASPHMGGSWERLVKSVKTVLKVTLKERFPKEEVLQTLIVEAENMVNSRPLTFVSSDSNDPESITPNHFLLNSSSGAAPLPGKFEEKDVDLRKQWRVSQALSDMFWRRWVKEYLPTLNVTSKWHSKSENVKVNDVVIAIDDTQPRNTWPLGIIQSVHYGRDGRVRVVDVKMKNGTFRRPVTKICKIADVTRTEEG